MVCDASTSNTPLSVVLRGLPYGCVSGFLTPTVPPSHSPHRLGKATFPSTRPALGVSDQKGLIDNGREETEDIWNVMVFPLGWEGEGPGVEG